MNTENISASSFQSPPSRFRPWTRWWWPGGDVVRDELLREVRQRHFADDLIETFRTNRGYDITPYLPAVFQPARDQHFWFFSGLRAGPDFSYGEAGPRIIYDLDLPARREPLCVAPSDAHAGRQTGRRRACVSSVFTDPSDARFAPVVQTLNCEGIAWEWVNDDLLQQARRLAQPASRQGSPRGCGIHSLPRPAGSALLRRILVG